jgi:hypothetical protein
VPEVGPVVLVLGVGGGLVVIGIPVDDARFAFVLGEDDVVVVDQEVDLRQGDAGLGGTVRVDDQPVLLRMGDGQVGQEIVQRAAWIRDRGGIHDLRPHGDHAVGGPGPGPVGLAFKALHRLDRPREVALAPLEPVGAAEYVGERLRWGVVEPAGL